MMGTAKASATRMQRVVSEDSNRSSNCRSWGRGASGHEVTEPRERKKPGCHKPKDNAKKETIKFKLVEPFTLPPSPVEVFIDLVTPATTLAFGHPMLPDLMAAREDGALIWTKPQTGNCSNTHDRAIPKR
jgi:hypothetical protein